VKGWIARSLAALALAACTHSDPITTPPIETLGPFSTGADVQITFNVDQDYWPAWTQDGRGILYSFVLPGSTASHRCLGLLPAAGGTRSWEMCDNRAVRNDTVNSYAAYALDSTGRLLVVEALSRTGFLSSFPFHIRLVLTDTATPYVRTILDTLPIPGDSIGSAVTVSWMSDIAWTGPNTFIALGQQFGIAPHCGMCLCLPCPSDSSFSANGIVLLGTIASGHGTLHPVAGTEGATAYSQTDNGATIVFIRGGDHRLFTVPIGGGAPVVVATVSGNANTLLGVSCRGSTCVVASDSITTFDQGPAQPPALLASATTQLISVTLGSGTVHSLLARSNLIATPQFSPVSSDLVVQVDGVWGHLQTFGGGNSSLHLYKGLVP
jgi:hypothetical protein